MLRQTPDNAIISTLVFMNDRVDLPEMNAWIDHMMANRSLRHQLIVEALMDQASFTQVDLIAHLDALINDGLDVSYTTFANFTFEIGLNQFDRIVIEDR